MTVEELLKHFEHDKHPVVSAGAFLGIHPQTIRKWVEKDGQVPVWWESHFKILKMGK